MKVRKGKQGKEHVHEVPFAKKKCSGNTAKPHLIQENKNEGGKNTEEKADVSPIIDQKKQSDILQKNKNMKIQGLLLAKCMVQAKKR